MDWIDDTAEHLKRDEVILCPTDTIWGISANALKPNLVDRIQEVKQRPQEKTFIVLMQDFNQLSQYTDQNLDVVMEFLANQDRPTTVIYDQAKNLPSNLIAQDGSIAVRIPREEWLLRLLNLVEFPILSTSANLSGKKSPASRNQIDPVIVDRVDFIAEPPFDSSNAQSSQIIRISTQGQVEWLRK